MNYRHAFHAGSFADVIKHIVLVRILTYLQEKPAAFRVIDSHAGAGRYDLTGDEAQRGGEWLTVGQVCAELKISPRTFYRWRAQGTGPRSKRIARGGVRVRRSWLDEWLDEPERGIA